jgi:hypothetical protein
MRAAAETGTKRVPKQANLTLRNPIQFHESPANLQVLNTPEATHNPKVAGSNPAPAMSLTVTWKPSVWRAFVFS